MLIIFLLSELLGSYRVQSCRWTASVIVNVTHKFICVGNFAYKVVSEEEMQTCVYGAKVVFVYSETTKGGWGRKQTKTSLHPYIVSVNWRIIGITASLVFMTGFW